MIVVSDTSPLIYLNLVGAIDVLPQLFGRVYVPCAVLQEIKDSRNPQLGNFPGVDGLLGWDIIRLLHLELDGANGLLKIF